MFLADVFRSRRSDVAKQERKVDELAEMKLGEEEEVGMMEQGMEKKISEVNWKILGTKALTQNKAQLSPTTGRPETRTIPSEKLVSEEDIEAWLLSTALQLGQQWKEEKATRAKRMLYTWQDVFETDLLPIKRTNLIEYAIVLQPNSKPYRAHIPLYTAEEIAFCRPLLSKMEEAGLIFRCDTEWDSRRKLPLRPRADTLPKEARLHMVHNFIHLNCVTVKSQYPSPRIELIVYTILKKGKTVFFTTDAANSYWALQVIPSDETKDGFVTPYRMYYYTVIGQGLTGGTYTYCRFKDLVFGALPSGTDSSSEEEVFLEGADSLIGDTGEMAFDGMINDSYGSASTFNKMYRFLHDQILSTMRIWSHVPPRFYILLLLQFPGLC